MKRIHLIFALLSTLLLNTGCFDDKGNYDYSDVNQLTINMNLSGVYATMGETIEINPTITFLNGTGDLERLTYKWYMKDSHFTRPDWNKLDFKWTADVLITRDDICLEVTDPVTGLKYYKLLDLEVKSRYNDRGLLVLSEKDGKTQFSFVKISSSNMQFSSSFGAYCPFEYVEYTNAYNLDNGGEDLPNGPMRLHQHFCGDESTIGQVLAITEGGAVDINGLDFKKEVTIDEVFDAGAYPAGLDYVADAMFMTRIDLVTDSEGHVYSRLKNTKMLFHSGRFLPNRLELNGEELKGCRFIPAPFDSTYGCLVHDTNNNRLLVITDTGSNSSNPNQDAGSVIALENTANPPENFLPVNDLSSANIIWIGYANLDAYSSMGYTMVFEKDGVTYCQEFVIQKAGNKALYSVTNPSVYEIKGLSGTPTHAYGATYKSSNALVFCAVRNELYLFDRSNPSLPADKYGEFRADIVAMDGDVYNSWWLGMGLADGSVLLLNAAKCGVAENQYVYYDSMREIQRLPKYKEKDGTLTDKPVNEGVPITYGKIVDIRLKIIGGAGWRVNWYD